MSPETQKQPETVLYDAHAKQRLEFDVTEGNEIFDTAHHYEPLSDERYLVFLKSIKAKGNDKEVDDYQLEANTALWNDLVKEVENFEAPADFTGEWKTLIGYAEKRDSLTNFLAVAIVEPETKSSGKRQGVVSDTQTITTEAYFNFPNISQQTHTLKKKPEDGDSSEWQKKYDRIQARRFRQEPTRGLRRAPKIEYIPQDEAIGRLYDEMFVSQTGFKDGVIPLRFKTTVIHYLFGGSTLDEKK